MALPPPPTATTCYRHPQREAGRQCTRCGKSACSECLVQAAVGSHCLDCAKAARPDLKTRVNFWRARQMTPVTTTFIALNVAVFVWTALGGGNIVAFDANRRHLDLGLAKVFLSPLMGSFGERDWYRIITSGFIQFGLIHLAMNMLALFRLGGVIERKLGGVRFGLLYLASLVGGSAGALLVSPNSLTGGASGAIFGLLAALAVGLWRQGVNVMNTDVGQVLMLNVMITVLGRSFISLGGHFGGALAGAACGFVMLPKPWKPTAKWTTYAAPIAVTVICVAVIVAYVS